MDKKNKILVLIIAACLVLTIILAGIAISIEVNKNKEYYNDPGTITIEDTNTKSTEPVATEATEAPTETTATEAQIEAPTEEAVVDDVFDEQEVEQSTTTSDDIVNDDVAVETIVEIQEKIIVIGELEPLSETEYPDSGTIVYTTHWVNVRSKPSTKGEIIGKIEEGERVLRYETSNGWSTIFYDGGVAYISNQYIDSTKIEKFDLYTPVDETVYSGHDVNIRLAPSIYSPSIGKLKQGDSVRRIGVGKDGWSQVMYKDDLYYINSRYLSTDPDFVIPIEWFLEQEAEKNAADNATNSGVTTESGSANNEANGGSGAQNGQTTTPNSGNTTTDNSAQNGNN